MENNPLADLEARVQAAQTDIERIDALNEVAFHARYTQALRSREVIQQVQTLLEH